MATDPMQSWRDNNVPWVPDAEEMRQFRDDLDRALRHDNDPTNPDQES